jgi:hypothetical protein
MVSAIDLNKTGTRVRWVNDGWDDDKRCSQLSCRRFESNEVGCRN